MTMTGDMEQATDWWEEFVADWPNQITITSMSTGKATTIKLKP